MVLFTSRKRQRAERRAEVQAKARSDEIDLHLKEDAKSHRRLCSVLLISIPESQAKAFVLVKQMKIVHEAYTHEEHADFRPVIWRILLQNARSIVKDIRSRKLGPARRSNKANCEYIMNHRIDTDSPEFSFLPKFGRAVQDLWAEEIIPVLLDHPSRLSVDDNAAYFFAEAQRIVAEEYVPSVEDILHAAEKGIMETYFKMDQLSIRVLQVYGQECEQRKWIHLIEGVTSIIFYASLCDYDKRVVGWNRRTRLAESFTLFEAIVNSRWFLRTSVLLFLTDIAEFTTKLHEVPLAQYFPEYTGGTDVNKGTKYILRQFRQFNRARLIMYPHITEASDVRNIRLLFSTVKDAIVQKSLINSDIL